MVIATVSSSAARPEFGESELTKNVMKIPISVAEITASGSALAVAGAIAVTVVLDSTAVIECTSCPTLAKPSRHGNEPRTTR